MALNEEVLEFRTSLPRAVSPPFVRNTTPHQGFGVVVCATEAAHAWSFAAPRRRGGDFVFSHHTADSLEKPTQPKGDQLFVGGK